MLIFPNLDTMQQKYKIDKAHKPFILRLMGKLWRGYKSELSRKVRDFVQCPSVTNELALKKPADVNSKEWDEFVKIRTSREFKVCS